ncbi:flagellar brake domain-containing protein [Bacillus sp. REN3]|uniref:flagellar brake protein n=1 Tax=Bacillus sp. REN3 TaxID=2802440 RepID=UPI001AEDD05A
MIKIGDNIILEEKYSDHSDQYKCKLVERRGNDLYIDYPINTSTGKTAFLLEGTPLKAIFKTVSGSHYVFETVVKGRVKLKIPMVVLSFPGNESLIKIQRRQYVRIDTSVDVAVHPVNGTFKPFTAVTDDISAGGAALIVPTGRGLKPGMKIDCWFVLPMQSEGYEYRKFRCKVVRIIQGDRGMEKVSIQFAEPSGADKRLLIRFCFEQQLAMKKKGLPV